MTTSPVMAKALFPDVAPGRRRNMQANRSKDTKPELVVRRYLHKAGLRYRLHRRDLPGKPDLTFPRSCTVVEVRGCFWHGHGCDLGQVPRSRRDYWEPKLAATRHRDQSNRLALEGQGWRVIELWECELRQDPDRLLGQLAADLHAARSRTR